MVARYLDGPLPGGAAITRHRLGAGHGWYLTTALDADGLAPLLALVYADAGVTASGLPEDVEVITRHGRDHSYVVAINHGSDDVTVQLPVSADLETGAADGPQVRLPAGAVRVLRG